MKGSSASSKKPVICVMSQPSNPYAVQWRMVKEIALRRERAEGLFGIDYLFRLFLCFGLMFMPAMFVRLISGCFGYLSRKISIEAFAIGKPFFLGLILLNGLFLDRACLFITGVLFVNLYLYLLGLVFLKRFYTQPVSHSRSMLLLIINFVEMTIAFAIFYGYSKSIYSSSVVINDPLSLLYFSFVTAATVGYGDMAPATDVGKMLVVFQILSSLGFISLFLATFVTNLNENERGAIRGIRSAIL